MLILVKKRLDKRFFFLEYSRIMLKEMDTIIEEIEFN